MSNVSALVVGEEDEGAWDEQNWVRAAQADARAFGPLYDRYRTRVYRYLRTRVVTDDDAANLTQQVFLKALRSMSSYRHRGLPFGAWLFRIARNVAADARRRERNTVQWDALPEVLQVEEGPDIESTILRKEALAELRSLLLQLSPGKRELIVLRFGAGLPVREIAAVVAKSEWSVYKQLARILQSLKEQYSGE